MRVNIVEHMIAAARSDRLNALVEEIATGVKAEDGTAVIAADRALRKAVQTHLAPASTSASPLSSPSPDEGPPRAAGSDEDGDTVRAVMARLKEIAGGLEGETHRRRQRHRSGLAYLRADARLPG
ncbi:MAG: hypothetical protein AAGF78_13905 [Pseudomonadota bacterium]